MKLSKQQIELMKEDVEAQLVAMLMHHYHYTMEEAMAKLYNSETFERLQNSETGLYYQSAGYAFSFLNDELSRSKL